MPPCRVFRMGGVTGKMERSLCYTRFQHAEAPAAPLLSQSTRRTLPTQKRRFDRADPASVPGRGGSRRRGGCRHSLRPSAAVRAAGGRERLSPDTLRAMDAYSPSRAVAKLK